VYGTQNCFEDKESFGKIAILELTATSPSIPIKFFLKINF
jgi:hypothetical protein